MSKKNRRKINGDWCEERHLKGFGRLTLVNVKTGKIEVDTGFRQNIITEDGFDDYIVGCIGDITASSNVTHMLLGTQTQVPLSTQNSISGEFGGRKTTTNTLVGNGTLRATANWATNEATQSTIGAVALTGTATGGSIGNVLTVATSNKTTDQQLNATVEWRFS